MFINHLYLSSLTYLFMSPFIFRYIFSFVLCIRFFILDFVFFWNPFGKYFCPRLLFFLVIPCKVSFATEEFKDFIQRLC